MTDANLALGRLPRRLAGGLELDVDAAARSLEGLDPADVVAVVEAGILRALRVISVEQGLDPRDFTLVAFGGAGPLHACALADELGLRRVLVPEPAGVLSALGLVVGDERRDHVRAYVCRLEEAGELPAEGEADLRYAGQSFELSVPLGPQLAERFHDAHEARYGYAAPARPIELVAARTSDVTRSHVDVAQTDRGRRTVHGPELVELDGATCWVPSRWHGERDADGTLVLERR